MASLLFIGTFVHTPRLGEVEILRDHLLEVSSEGKIVYLSPISSPASYGFHLNFKPSEVVRLPRHTFLLPTFTDVHIHAPQYLYAGTGLDLPLMSWLERYAFRAETRIDGDTALAEKVYTRLGQRLLENGTSAALIFGTIKAESNLILARVFASLGLRTYIGKLSMDQNGLPDYVEKSASEAIVAASTFIDDVRALAYSLPEGQRNLVHPVRQVITPRFVPTCSDALLIGLGKLAQVSGARCQSHMCEAQDQVDWVRSMKGCADEEVFRRSGLLTEKTTQAHCTFLTPETIALVKKQGTSIAHCPLSNAYFSSQIFPLRACLDAGIDVGLGSDCAGGHTLDLAVQMRHAVTASRLLESASPEPQQPAGQPVRITWQESLYLATRGGALALAEPLVGGRLQVGEFFDAQIIELASPDGVGIGALDFFDDDPVTMADSSDWWQEAIEKWWCVGSAVNRKAMYVQGRQVR